MGGGGGGSTRYIGPWTPALQQKFEQAREQEQQRLDKNANLILQELLSRFNSRAAESTIEKLEDIKKHLGKQVEFDKILYGGSVAKHTDVDGISDVDALVILDRSDLEGKPPQNMLNAFYKVLQTSLPSGDVDNIEKGHMAVTVKYKDGTEIQLLPALKSRNTISIASDDGKSWNDTKPKIFQQKLTDANSKARTSLPYAKHL